MNETDLKPLCRICLSNSSLCSNIYVGQSSEDDPIYEVINYVYDLEISIDDGLPEYVCQECLGIIKEFENYKRNAHRAKKELILLRDKKDVFIKVEEEDYLDSSDPQVAADGQIHEPQIEIHESGNYGNNSQEDEEKHNFINDIEVHPIIGRRGRRRQRTDEERKFRCEDCGKCFALEERLNSHILVHSGEKPYVCEQCGRRFNRKNYLTEHLMIHTGQKPFECTECNKRFIRKYDLNVHLMVHRGEKPFVCGQCGKGFLRNNELTKHLKIHSGLKPWRCGHCGKGFVRKCDLKRHQTIHDR
ncbi:hypothetical protein J437_LFUL018021 [Ladona fulva]|uniref:Uncharacterized protein n=1 Tax=Ladona fulva TaxID=123851 RepID=A0A8K0KLU6_LADFU|nr:hypothetical protein J437_LFUL018021 [Ladona fulva]